MYVLHPWHGAHYGEDAPAIVNGLIEISQGSRAKYEIDKTTGLLKLDRVIYSSFHYPVNYGFIPQTYCDDKDPLDILVLSSVEAVPLCLIDAKVIGVMRMVDNNEQDDKIIAVAKNDKSVNHIEELEDLPQHTMDQIKRFFEDYKKLENKIVKVEKFLGRQDAYKIIEEAILLYKEKKSELIGENPMSLY